MVGESMKGINPSTTCIIINYIETEFPLKKKLGYRFTAQDGSHSFGMKIVN